MMPAGTERCVGQRRTMGRRQHYVPKFYLRRFSHEGRQIGLLRLSDGLIVPGASIKDQASRPNYYGGDGAIEDALQELEGVYAPLVHDICARRKLPGASGDDYGNLLSLVAVQFLRTTRAADRFAGTIEKMLNAALDECLDDSQLVIKMENAPLFILRGLEYTTVALADLEPLLLSPPKGLHFVTSDNPVATYNQFCEGVAFRGVNGAASTGLQVFFPLSPDLTLALIDPNIYEPLVSVRQRLVRVSRTDTGFLNLLQLVGADAVVYFRDDGQAQYLRKLKKQAEGFRAENNAVVDEFEAVDSSDKGTVFQAYVRQPPIGFRLSFIGIRAEFEVLSKVARSGMLRPTATILNDDTETEDIPPDLSGKLFRRVS